MTPMKNSNIEWIGEIPSSWDVRRLQYCLSEVNVKNSPVQTNIVLSLVKDKGVMPYEEKGNQGNKSKEEASEYHLAYPNTIVLNCMNILIGSVGISNYFGCVSPVYYVFKETEDSELRFVNYIFNTREFQKELRKYAKGILEIRLRVSANDIFKQKIALPSKEIQIRIANFLDQKCSEIDSLSADIQSQIDTLEDYKKSVIIEAVTKGLNPDVEMKDSGVEWIETIPKNWNVCRLKYCLSNNDGGVWGNDPSGSVADKIVLRSTEQTIDGHWNITDPAIRSIGNYCKHYQILCNDLLITKSSGSSLHIGKTTLADEYFNQNECYYSNFLQRLRVNENIVPKFLWYLMNNPIIRNQFVIMQNSTIGIGNINADNINAIVIPVPSIQEQIIINQFLDIKCAEIDTVIADKKTQLETLAEYKKSLIYEYVTGKKEVINESDSF